MKIVTITLLVDDKLDSSAITADEIAQSVVTAMVEAKEEDNPWGGLNCVPVYIEQVMNVNVFEAPNIEKR